MKRLAAAACALSLLVAPAVAAAQEAVFFVRHAERVDQSVDSPLSGVGETRAERLAEILKDSGITQIYTTERRRTAQTAAPLAAALRLTPTAVVTSDIDALFARLHAATPQDRVLVVGHSNTLPEMLRRAGVATPIEIGDTEYDNLFVVIPRQGSAPLLVRLRY